MKFIRKNGRIIPIKDKGESSQKGSSQHGKFAVSGAASGAVTRMAMRKSKGKILSLNPKLVAVSALMGAVTTIANIKNSYEHGKNKKSFGHGVGRYITNSLAGLAGSAAGGAGLEGISGGAKAARKTGVFKKVGSGIGSMRDKMGKFADKMKGPIKKKTDLSKFKGKTVKTKGYTKRPVAGYLN